MTRRIEQNPLGDLVVPVENGEIVSLPRLWGFDLTTTTHGSGTLTTTTGLIAVIQIDDDCVTVGEVSQQVDSRRETIT